MSKSHPNNNKKKNKANSFAAGKNGRGCRSPTPVTEGRRRRFPTFLRTFFPPRSSLTCQIRGWGGDVVAGVHSPEKENSFHLVQLIAFSSWSRILRARGGYLVNKVLTLLQFGNRRLGGNVFIVRPPTWAPMVLGRVRKERDRTRS